MVDTTELLHEFNLFRNSVYKATRPQLASLLKLTLKIFENYGDIKTIVAETGKPPKWTTVVWSFIHHALYSHWGYVLTDDGFEFSKYRQRLMAFLEQDIESIRTTLLVAWTTFRGNSENEQHKKMAEAIRNGFKFDVRT